MTTPDGADGAAWRVEIERGTGCWPGQPVANAALTPAYP